MGTLLDLQLNERAYLVSVVATIFVPLTCPTPLIDGSTVMHVSQHEDCPYGASGMNPIPGRSASSRR